jgi:hypothetical protein
MRYTPEQLANILDLHRKWLRGEAGGSRANLTEANLSGANLTEANLSGANLTEANLSGANLTRAYLREADLTRANLTGVDLPGANLRRANLRGANLREADLTGAYLPGADLTKADLSGADLSGADLCGVNGTGTIGIKLITIHLSPYSLTYRSDTGQIHIGCRCLTAEEWLGLSGQIRAEENGFSDEQIAVYRESIQYLQRMATQCK